MHTKRRKTRQVYAGGVKIGGTAPVTIQSMAKTDTRDVDQTVRQIREMELAGCQITRVAVKDADAAKAIRHIRQKINIPLVADIHFDYRLALLAIQNGADKIRLNPGNINKPEEVQMIAEAASAKGIPIRIGVNSGSIEHNKIPLGGEEIARKMVKLALDYARLLERLKFYDIVISLKASDVPSTVEAYRIIAKKCNYPLHLGVTAAGAPEDGKIKSAVGIGALLMEGIGDTIRVSLTGEPVLEVIAARQILEAAGLRRPGLEVISCPTCGRCQVDLVRIVEEFKQKLCRGGLYGRPKGQGQALPLHHSIKVAIMGCEVNGPGEAKDADIGIAAGKGSGMLFKNGRPVKKVAAKDFVKVLLHEFEKM